MSLARGKLALMSDVSVPEDKRALLQRLQLGDMAGKRILDAVDQAVTSRWEPAQRRAKPFEGREVEASIQEIRRTFRTELGVAGAAAGGAAAVPGSVAPGVAAGLAEIGWSTVRLTDMILTIAVVHGHERASVEERRAWVLSVLAYGDAAAGTFSKVAAETAKGVGAKATKAIPTSVLQSVNRTIGRTIVTKYGTKRGAIALGRLLPLGVGAGIGYGLNSLLVVQVSRHADKFFRSLPPALAAPDS